MDEPPPVGTSQGLFHFTEPMPAYAGCYLHKWDSPVHTHSFVEIAFAVGGAATHHFLAGRREMRPGDVVLLRPGAWHGYENCQRFEVYNCCFSSELLRRELSWTREDPLLGFLLWDAPYSSPGRGILTISLRPSALGECLVHLDALAALRHRPLALHRPEIVGRLSLLFGQLGQAVVQARGTLPGETGIANPAVVRAIRLLEADLARGWTLTGLAAELHLAPGYLVRLFKDATGLPPMAYLAQLRAEHAALLLLHSDEPVTSIGRAVGWPDQSGFARRFKAHYGLSADFHTGRSGQPSRLNGWQQAGSPVRLPAGMSWRAGCRCCLVLRDRGTGRRDCHLLCMRDDAAWCPVCLIRRGTDHDIQVAGGMIRALPGCPPGVSWYGILSV